VGLALQDGDQHFSLPRSQGGALALFRDREGQLFVGYLGCRESCLRAYLPHAGEELRGDETVESKRRQGKKRRPGKITKLRGAKNLIGKKDKSKGKEHAEKAMKCFPIFRCKVLPLPQHDDEGQGEGREKVEGSCGIGSSDVGEEEVTFSLQGNEKGGDVGQDRCRIKDDLDRPGQDRAHGEERRLDGEIGDCRQREEGEIPDDEVKGKVLGNARGAEEYTDRSEK